MALFIPNASTFALCTERLVKLTPGELCYYGGYNIFSQFEEQNQIEEIQNCMKFKLILGYNKHAWDQHNLFIITDICCNCESLCSKVVHCDQIIFLNFLVIVSFTVLDCVILLHKLWVRISFSPKYKSEKLSRPSQLD